MEIELNKMYLGDALEILKSFPDNIVNCCVTSPPYYGLHVYKGKPVIWGGDPSCKHEWTNEIIAFNTCGGWKDPNDEEKRKSYGMRTVDPEKLIKKKVSQGEFCIHCGAWKGHLGLEPTPELYVQHIVLIFKEVKRVLRKDGTLWLNLGDSYWGSGNRAGHTGKSKNLSRKTIDYGATSGITMKKHPKLKPKDLIGIPWMIAFALRADGWWLRQDIIWNKSNPMPESVNDRCTKSHEYIFLLSKSAHYYFNQYAIKSEMKEVSIERAKRGLDEGNKWHHGAPGSTARSMSQPRPNVRKEWNKSMGGGGSGFKGHSGYFDPAGRIIGDGKANKKSVWDVPTKGYSGAHFAVYPGKLIEDCIKAGCPEQVCSKCGNPKIPIIKKTLLPTKKAARKCVVSERDLMADENVRGSNLRKDGLIPGWYNSIEITGWKATCKCKKDFVPGIVLDPFSGTNTTGIVARKQNKNFISIEISPESIKLAEGRMREELGIWK